jgi:hypothetical protein
VDALDERRYQPASLLVCGLLPEARQVSEQTRRFFHSWLRHGLRESNAGVYSVETHHVLCFAESTVRVGTGYPPPLVHQRPDILTLSTGGGHLRHPHPPVFGEHQCPEDLPHMVVDGLSREGVPVRS